MRLIDAAAIKLSKGFFENVNNVPKFYEWLNTLPTIDAVPVVRRKDWFCAKGERKEDEQFNQQTGNTETY